MASADSVSTQSGDTADGFASGGNLIASQTRAELFAGAYPFPKVPREVKAFGECDSCSGLLERC